jgi:uncharacterized membrane protein
VNGWAEAERRPGFAWRCLVVIAGLASIMAIACAQAAEVEQMKVVHAGKAYTIKSTVRLNAARDEVYRAATDFERLPSFDPDIVSSRLVGNDQLDSVMRLCVIGWCKRIRQVMHYTLTPDRRIDMQIVPGVGDLKDGSAHWQFTNAGPGKGTRMRLQARVVPDFWVPPLVGPLLIRRELRQQMQTTANAIEALADTYSHKAGE